jgi:PAS domain S-box-containing protein
MLYKLVLAIFDLINIGENITPSFTITNINSIHFNKLQGEVTMSLWLFIGFWIAVIIIFIAATFILRGKRQRHLMQERNMMKSLIDNVPDTIYFKDLDSKFILVNKAQAKLLGLKKPEDAIGKSDFDFFEHARDAYNIEQEIIKTKKTIINRINKHVVNGETHYLSDTKIPLTGTNGDCIGTVGISRDITDLKKAEITMLEHQSKFKALFDNAPLAIFRLDKDMKVVECNHRFRSMFGYTEDDDLSNTTKYDLLYEPEIGSLIIDTVLERKEVNTEILLKRKNGNKFIANLTLALLDDGFKDVSIEGIVDDITQVAKVRDEIIKAKDKAVEADKLKSLFLANMSHEIRTPMNAIIGFTNMLREDGLSAEDRNSFIDVIQSNGNSLMTIIDSIVDFSKLETEQMSVSKGEFNFKPLYDSVFEHAKKLLRTEEKHNAVKLIQDTPENPEVRLKSDRERLGQVMTYIVSNAIKFTDEGEICIGYRINNEKINIFVSDTGIGIPKNKQKVIFDRFSKVNNDKNRLYGGTGIGLTISRGLTDLMNGKIFVNSEPKKGSTFTIELKLNE